MNDENRYETENEATEQPAEQPAEPPAQQPSVQAYMNGWGQMPPPPPKKKKNGALILVCVLCAVVVVLLMVLTAVAASNVDWSSLMNGETTTTTTTKPQGNVPVLGITELEDGADGLTTREIVKRNLDSTVLIKTYGKAPSFGNGFPFGQSGSEQETHLGSASGIVMTADGYIITNWHCVIDEDTGEPFSRIDVVMYDETTHTAKVIGADETTDLAVIKIEATGLTPAEFGDSTQMQLGDRVVALGNAGGLGFSATQGILSGLARDVYEDTGYAIQCFQVDAAINPGNSGGPLFNAAGQVVAVNSAKIAAEGYEGLGFAIPINEAKAIVDSLIANGFVRGRVSLGITGQSYADAYYSGFLIYTINEDSPLRQTTVQKGDLIVAVNDIEVTDYASLRAALAKNKVGDTVTLKLLRAGNRRVQEFTVQTKLTEAKQ